MILVFYALNSIFLLEELKLVDLY